ncbi:MAG: hypothetical protein AAGJ31_10785, partial [Verrucomicrobiota bacterium]
MDTTAEYPSPFPSRTLRIFISSPGDVQTERVKAAQVISQLGDWYGADVHLEPIFWEQLPLEISTDFQNGIDPALASIDIAIFILWSRIGTQVVTPDGRTYASGTEREWHLMLDTLEAYGGQRPDILFYRREDDDSLRDQLAQLSPADIQDSLAQNQSAKAFFQTHFKDETGRTTRAFHKYRSPVEFGSRLKVHLRSIIDAKVTQGIHRTQARWTDSPPYRGLEPFHLEHADIFFG